MAQHYRADRPDGQEGVGAESWIEEAVIVWIGTRFGPIGLCFGTDSYY